MTLNPPPQILPLWISSVSTPDSYHSRDNLRSEANSREKNPPDLKTLSLERSGRLVGGISIYFTKSHASGDQVTTRKPSKFTTINTTTIKVWANRKPASNSNRACSWWAFRDISRKFTGIFQEGAGKTRAFLVLFHFLVIIFFIVSPAMIFFVKIFLQTVLDLRVLARLKNWCLCPRFRLG